MPAGDRCRSGSPRQPPDAPRAQPVLAGRGVARLR